MAVFHRRPRLDELEESVLDLFVAEDPHEPEWPICDGETTLATRQAHAKMYARAVEQLPNPFDVVRDVEDR